MEILNRVYNLFNIKPLVEMVVGINTTLDRPQLGKATSIYNIQVFITIGKVDVSRRC